MLIRRTILIFRYIIPWIKCIHLTYIYLLLLLYKSSILDIEHSPYYIALGSTQTHKVIYLRPITKTIQVRRARHAGHCWRSRGELIRDVLLWTPTHGRSKAGRPARTYIQQLSEDTGCCPEDLPRAMNDREESRERVRDIRATSAIWWWYIYIYIYRERGRILYKISRKFLYATNRDRDRERFGRDVRL